MGDTAENHKKDVNRRTNKKSSRINRIVSLFEIPRPNKSRGLQRTNSLPAPRRPSIPEEEHVKSSTSKVKRIKEEIEQNNAQREIVYTPKPMKKKTTHHQRKILEEKEDWLADKAKIMEDLNKLQERIEDVSHEIQNSDTELEITHKHKLLEEEVNEEEPVFEDSEENNYCDREVLRDKVSDDEDSDDATLNRLSNDTVRNSLSSNTIKEFSELKSEAGNDSDGCDWVVSYDRFVSAESVISDGDSHDNGGSQDIEKNCQDSRDSSQDNEENGMY